MKSKDFPKIVFSKRQVGDEPIEILCDLSGRLCLKTIKRWCKMVDQVGSINIGHPTGLSCILPTLSNIEKVKNRMKGRRRLSARRLSKELKISSTNFQKI